MMRRSSPDNFAPRTGEPPFRVLVTGGTRYQEPPSPPPPKTPDPYKVPVPNSYQRAHRNSSFVIIAEAGHDELRSRSPSPTLNSGRVSPFRGRGFKGPLPHAQSRPHTPELGSQRQRRRVRIDRRVSVSQQNSPKRSMIPQPTARRSASLGKSLNRVGVVQQPNNDKSRPSPRVERRVVTRNTLKPPNNVAAGRRQSLRPPGLPPLPQGAQNRHVTRTNQHNSRWTNGGAAGVKPTPATRTRGSLSIPPKSVSNAKRASANKSNGNKDDTSSSKIPLRRGSNANRFGSTPLLTTGRFITLKPSKSNRDISSSTGGEDNNNRGESAKGNDEVDLKSGRVEDVKMAESKERRSPIVELLQQTSGVTGTSDVVNLTTATVVKPLQIEVKTIPANPPAAAAAAAAAEAPKVEEKTTIEQAPSDRDKPGKVEEVKPPAPQKESPRKTVKEVRIQSSTDLKKDGVDATSSKPAEATVRQENSREKSVERKVNGNAGDSKVDSGVSNGPTSVKPAASVESGDKDSRHQPSNVSSVKSSSPGLSIGTVSVKSSDTGVSVNTVKGVSSPRENTGVHVVKRPEEIETLSRNVMHMEQNGDSTTTVPPTNQEGEEAPKSRTAQLYDRLKKSFAKNCKCLPDMRCLACRRDAKGSLWKKKSRPPIQRDVLPTIAQVTPAEGPPPLPGCWTRFKNACRCPKFNCKAPKLNCCKNRARVAPAERPCCPPERRCGALCGRLFSKCKCCRGSDERRTRNIRAKQSITSVTAPPVPEEPKSKIPDVLVEHNSLMRGAIPCLPVFCAWFCLFFNIFLPGSGTILSGLFNLCIGQPRFSQTASGKARIGAFIVNLIVGVSQCFTVLFCLVGWGWSIWWGVTMVKLARKFKRFKVSEAASGDVERAAGEPSGPPGVPSQALRGIERAR